MSLRNLGALHLQHLSTGREIASLDGVRGFAVILVLLDHMSDAGLYVIPGLSFNRAGRFGVLLFFSLSAFLLTLPFWMRPAAELTRWQTWRDYSLRRFFRIFPLYALVLAVTAWHSGDGFNFSDVWRHLLLLDGQRHFWTILVEVKYYLVLPVFVLGVLRLWRRKWWLGLLALALFWAGLKTLLPPLEAWWNPGDQLWLHRYIQVFLLGSVAGSAHAIVTKNQWDLRRWQWPFEALSWTCIALAILFLPAVGQRLVGHKISVPGGDTSLFAVVWSAFIFSHLYGTGFLRRILEFPALRFVGFISFSLYLWHRLLLNEIKTAEFAPHWKILLFLSTLAAVASASYLLVERPLSRIRLFSVQKTG